jgi:hypothetical protein
MSRSARRWRTRPSWMSRIWAMSSRRSGWKFRIPSRRFKNSGRKCAAQGGLAGGLQLLALEALGQQLAADVAGHQDDRVLEVDDVALAVGEAAVVEDLQQQVEDLGVGLLDLVEEDDAVGTAAHGLGELAALLVADVAGRRADQARDRELLHVLAHVDAHDVALVVEQELGERLGELGLADAGGAEEQEAADRARRGRRGRRATDGRRRRPGRPPRSGRRRACRGWPPSAAGAPARSPASC